MIPLIPTELGTPVGQAASKRRSSGEGAVASAFDDFMVAPDVANADMGAAANGAASEVEVEEPDLVLLPAQEAIGGDEQSVLASFRLDAMKDARPVSDITILQPRGKEPGPPLRMLASSPGPDPARAGMPAQTVGAETADAKPVFPSVAQTVLEGRLPQAVEALVGRARIARVGPQDIAAPEAPSRSGVLPLADKTAGTPVHPPAMLTPSTGAAPDDGGNRRRADPPRLLATDAAPKPAPPALAQAQPPAVAIAQVAAGPQHDVVEKNLSITEGELIISPAPAERQMPVASAQGSASVSAAPESARNAATQIAAAIAGNEGKTTEILLNPEELGRVRLSMAVDDNAIVLNVSAERSETQDLLRRHMDQLAQEFRDLGYASISFTFGEQKDEAQTAFSQPDETPEPEILEVTARSNTDADQTTSGLDLRI